MYEIFSQKFLKFNLDGFKNLSLPKIIMVEVLKAERKLYNRTKFDSINVKGVLSSGCADNFFKNDEWQEVYEFIRGRKEIDYNFKRVDTNNREQARVLDVLREALFKENREISEKFGQSEDLVWEIWSKEHECYYVLVKDDKPIITSAVLDADEKYDVMRFRYKSIDHLLIIQENFSYGAPAQEVKL